MNRPPNSDEPGAPLMGRIEFGHGYWPSVSLGTLDDTVQQSDTAELVLQRLTHPVVFGARPSAVAHPDTGHRYILTATGVQFDFDSPTVEQINITDIAAHLSKICRFTGACREFYSVAQHSELVSRLVPAEYALEGLLHDAPEAYISDVSSPLKDVIREVYGPLEDRVWALIAEKFGLPSVLSKATKNADLVALGMEYRDLMPRDTTTWKILDGINIPAEVIIPWSPRYARERFIQRYNELTGSRYS